MDQDQERPSSYVMDAIHNGNWLCQRDLSGDITSKPPFYTWLAALFTLSQGRISILTMYLPGALSAMGVALLVWSIGRRHFGDRAALWAAFASLLTTATVKEIGLARTDGVFTFTVTATAFIAFRCWNRGGGWTLFWLAGAIATLTKGPLGVILAGGGLLAAWWEKRTVQDRFPLKGSHLFGVLLFFAIAAGWLWLSYFDQGQAVLDKIIGKELVGNAVKNRKNSIPGTLFWQPPLFYLGRAAPWSLFAYWGFWRLFKNPAINPRERRFERFLFCWFFVGLTIFSISPHQRGDLLWPIMSAGALIAGREIARLTAGWSIRRIGWSLSGAVVIALVGFSFYYGRIAANTRVVKRTVAVQKIAAEIEQAGGNEFPLTHIDTPITLQFYLYTLRPLVTAERATQLLRGLPAAFVAVNDLDALQKLRNESDPEWFTLLPRDTSITNSPVWIVSNRPELKAGDHYAFCFGTLALELKGTQLKHINQRYVELATFGESDEIQISNEGSEPRRIEVRCGRLRSESVLKPGETWRLTGREFAATK